VPATVACMNVFREEVFCLTVVLSRTVGLLYYLFTYPMYFMTFIEGFPNKVKSSYSRPDVILYYVSTVGYATTNDATTNECYNEQFLAIKSGCYNERGGP
jgi:hypothetical protein